jgi:hypothetical protein
MKTAQSKYIVALLIAFSAATACVQEAPAPPQPEGQVSESTDKEWEPRRDLGTTKDLGKPRDLDQPKDLATMNPCRTSAFCTSKIADPTLDLMTSVSTTFSVLSHPAYSGMVNLTVRRTAIDALSGGKAPDVDISLDPAVVSLGPAAPPTVTIHLSTTTAAAAFSAVPFTLHLEDAKDPTMTFDVQVHLTVRPVLTIAYDGDGHVTKHRWSTDRGALTGVQVRQRPIIAGAGGTTFVFLNNDINPHIIHGSGKIIHQNSALGGTPPHGTYVVPNVNDTAIMQTNYFYCHSHGLTGSDPPGARNVTFIP